MGIKAIIDSADDLPEGLKDFYRQDEKDENRFILDIDGIDDHPKVRGVITANKTNRETRDRLRRENEEMKSRFSFLPEEFDADAFNTLKSAAEGKGGKPTDEQVAEMRERLKSSIEGKYKPELEARDQRITRMDAALRRMVIDEGLSKAMDEAAIDRDFKDAAIALVQRQAKIDLEESDGAYKASVETDLGPVSLSQFIKEWAGTDQGRKFVAKSTGHDPKGGKGGGAGRTMSTDEFNGLGAKERADFMKNGGTLKG